MKKKRTLFVACIVAPVVLIIGVLVFRYINQPTPAEVTKTFYTEWLRGIQNNAPADTYRSYKELSPQMIAFLDSYYSLTPTEGADHDPILCAQDIPFSFGTHEVARKGKDATVAVDERFSTDLYVTVELQKISGSWKISSVDCEI